VGDSFLTFVWEGGPRGEGATLYPNIYNMTLAS